MMRKLLGFMLAILIEGALAGWAALFTMAQGAPSFWVLFLALNVGLALVVLFFSVVHFCFKLMRY